MATIRELVVEQKLVRDTQRRGGIAYKLTVPGRRNVPDRLLLMPGGRAIFVECKAPGQKPRMGQQRELERLKALGFETYFLDCVETAWIFDGTPKPGPDYIPPAIRKRIAKL